MKTVLSGLALTVWIAACGLVPPPGSRAFVTQVTNTGTVPVELTVKTPTGVVQGAAQPASLAPGRPTRVTFYLPPGNEYTVMANGMPVILGTELDQFSLGNGCQQVEIEVNADGSGAYGCHMNP